MIKFRFGLYPLDEVSPWGRHQPVLQWFGLTDGWYWIEASGQELLRRTRQVEPHLAQQPQPGFRLRAKSSRAPVLAHHPQ